jgi:hypothetical protein
MAPTYSTKMVTIPMESCPGPDELTPFDTADLYRYLKRITSWRVAHEGRLPSPVNDMDDPGAKGLLAWSSKVREAYSKVPGSPSTESRIMRGTGT